MADKPNGRWRNKRRVTAELGFSSKQVQGFRMGSAREIASRRERVQRNQPVEPMNADEVIRYLRQRDDVGVPQGDGFLVNWRFQLSLSALIERANKMRDRQGKAPFKSAFIINHILSRSQTDNPRTEGTAVF